MTATSKTEEDIKKFTGWKLDVQKAVRADKKVGLSAASVFAAFMDYVNKETRMAWPSMGALALATGSSPKTVKKHMNRLVEAKWLEPIGKGPRGTIKYRVTDHRMNAIMDLVAIEQERLREQQRKRQEKRRQSRRDIDDRPASGPANHANEVPVTEQGFRPNPPLSQYKGSDPSQYTGTDEHLQATPSVGSYEGRETYRRASNGE